MAYHQRKKTPKNLIIAILLLLIVLLAAILIILKPKKTIFPDNISLFIKNQGYYLEVAQTKESLQKGLSGRDNLCFNCGMLFVFNRPDKQSFWMKDTRIPLDIIWLDSKFQIVKIITAVKTDSSDIYLNEKPAKYVIELNANEALKLGLKVGDTIDIPLP